MRNRLKRCMREAVRHSMIHIPGGWDMIFVARGSMVGADFGQIETAIQTLLQQSGLWVESVAVDE